jgi:SAM-dependent methyltransferase
MHYDPIKKSLGSFFNRAPVLRILFYKLLDLLLLRAWHIHIELKKWAERKKNTVHILDAGSGFGQYSYYLSGFHKDWNIMAVDVKEEQVCDCNKFFNEIGRKNIIFKIEDLTTFVQPDAFDLILSVDVMEHIEEDVKVFQNFHASLKPGGMLLISTPSDQGGSDVHEDGETSFIEEHVRDGYNIKDIEEKLKKAGFWKVYARYSYGTPGKISWRLSMKYPIQMLGVSKAFFILLPFYYLIAYPVSFVLNYIDSRMFHETGTGLIVKAWKSE